MKIISFLMNFFKRGEKKESYLYIDHLEMLKNINTYFNNFKELKTYLQLVLEANNKKDMMDINKMFVISETTLKATTMQDFFSGEDIFKCLQTLKDYKLLLTEKINNEKDTYLIRMTKVSLRVIEEILNYF